MTSPTHGSARRDAPYRAPGRIHLLHGDTLCSTDYRDCLEHVAPRYTKRPWAERAAHNCLCAGCAPHSWTRTSHPGISDPGVGHWHINATSEKPVTTRYTQVANDVAPDDDIKGPAMLLRVGVLTNMDMAATVHPFMRDVLDY
jgi:hypothetical protein